MTTIKVFIQYEQDPTQYLATEISKPACNSLRLPPSAHQVVVLQPGVVQQSRADAHNRTHVLLKMSIFGVWSTVLMHMLKSMTSILSYRCWRSGTRNGRKYQEQLRFNTVKVYGTRG